MPVSSKRKKAQKKVHVPKELKPLPKSPVSEYIDDFLDNVIESLDNDDFALVSVLQDAENKKDETRHYYVLSRNKEGKLLEHNEGPRFKQKFVRAVENNIDGEENPLRIMIGYFSNEQVNVKTLNGAEGLDFRTPHYAAQWKVIDRKFVPDSEEYNWNGYMVQPGGHVSRSF